MIYQVKEKIPELVGLDIQDGMKVYEPDGEQLTRFLEDRSHVSIIRGPIGSGTSTACCMKIYSLALEQKGDTYTGKRRSKWAIVRDTYPNLRDTTMKTWLEWFPEKQYGEVTWSRPMLHEVRVGDLELDVYFLALDGDEDIKKLRSLELTGAWANEIEYMSKPIFDEIESRTGRFPALKDGGSSWDGVIADLNAPNEEHWIPQMMGEVPPSDDISEEELELLKKPASYAYFVQPPALLEIRSPDQRQVIGYKMNPLAENAKWLKEGYYEEKVQGKKKAWIDSRLRNEITFVIDGDPVWKSFSADTHIAKAPLTPIKGYDVIIGMDFGRRPCGVFMQEINNRIQIQYEFRAYGIGAASFAPMFKRFLEKHYLGYNFRIYGDPKGQDRGQADERTAYEIFAAHGMFITPAPVKNNHLETRLAAVENALNEMHHGFPRVLVSPIGCPTLKAAFCGRYHIKKTAWGDPMPFKDKYSDVADCVQYAFLGMGEGRRMIGLTQERTSGRVNVRPARQSLRRVS